MDDLTPMQKEEISRLWCSKENNMKLDKDHVWFWDENDNIYQFEFDIASNPRRKEIEELEEKIRKQEKQYGKTANTLDTSYILKRSELYGRSSDGPDHREVIGMVKSGKHSNGNNTYHAILGDCFLLSKAKADKKYMILTDKIMYDYFYERCKAILGEIELVYLDPYEYRYLLDDLK